MNELLDIIKIHAIKDFHLELEFENGEIRLFDMKPFLNKKPFQKLQNKNLFECASVKHGTVVWPGNIDIAPERFMINLDHFS